MTRAARPKAKAATKPASTGVANGNGHAHAAAKRCYGVAPPGMDLELPGKLIVLEGQDSSGRSTHVAMLGQWLQQSGYAVVEVGLKRSDLVGPELEEARKGNTLSPRTMSLFYATDFYDQLENRIVPALRAGAVVLADRYIFTLIARDLARGAEPLWVQNVYSKAIVPDALFYLQASPRTLLERRLERHEDLDYWESGMDLGVSRDWHESFLHYQRRMAGIFKDLLPSYGFDVVNANRSVPAVNRDLQARVQTFLQGWRA